MASSWVGTTRPEGRELRACGLAALAESGVLVLPVWLVLTEARGLKIGVMALAVPFVAVYVGGAMLACRFRASRNVAFGAAMLATLAGIWLGHGDLNRTVFAVLVCLLVSFRLVTLALRDWRLPIHAEVGWFALALGFEVMVAAGATDEWRGPLLLFVPLFFVAALASRASTVWTSGGAGELDERVRAAWIRRALIATGALVGAMAAAVVLSVEGGVFDRIGVWLTPAANAVATFLAWLLSQAARPVFFLVDLLGIDPDRVRELLDSLRDSAAGRAVEPAPRRPARDLAADARVPGVRGDRLRRVPGDPALPAARRRRAGATRAGDPDRGGARDRGRVAPSRPRLRRELPADTVRRWYAETLLALRRLRHRSRALADADRVRAGRGRGRAGLRGRVRAADATPTRTCGTAACGSTRPRSGGSKQASSGSCRRSGAAEPRPPADVDPGLPAPTQERFRRFDEFGARPRSPCDVGGSLRPARREDRRDARVRIRTRARGVRVAGLTSWVGWPAP